MRPIRPTILLCLYFYFVAFSSQSVYLLHGFGSGPAFMATIHKHLLKNNYHSINYSYPSITRDLTVCGDSLYHTILNDTSDTVSFVTHSMGALVLRSMLVYSQNDSTFPKIFRVVMIAPANKGAEIADFFASKRIFRFLMGPNISHLSTDTSSLAHHLPVPSTIDIGIIVGVKNSRRGYNPFIKGNNDGFLTPQSTRLGTERDMVEVPAQHIMIIHNPKVLEYINEFLSTGMFFHE